MRNYISKPNISSKYAIKEKNEIARVQKHLEIKHEKVKTLISIMFSEINNKETRLKNDSLDTSEKSMLEYDISCFQGRLEKAIYEKELIRKDLAIVQTQLRKLEDEINKTKPWWFKLFRSKK